MPEVVATEPSHVVVLDGVDSTATTPEGDPNATNTADQGPATDPDGAKPDTPEELAAKRARRDQNKLNKAYRRAAEAEARAKVLEENQARFQQQQPRQDPSAPQLEDFTDLEDFRKAVEKHASERTKREIAQRHNQAQQQQYVANLAAQWAAKSEKAEDRYDDYAERVGDLKPTSVLSVAIMEADNGPEIAYYLATHRNELASIASLSHIAQVRAVGRLEAKLAAQSAKPRTPSGAPEPIKTVGASAAPGTKKLSELSQNEFEKRRKAYIAARK